MNIEQREALAESVRELSRHLSGGGSDYLERALICTPVLGSYKTVSHWIICLEGSPPRGLFVISLDEGVSSGASTFVDDGRAKRLGSTQSAILFRFKEEFLRGMIVPLRVSANSGRMSP